VIYGDVDIHELYETSAEIRALARERVGMLAPRDAIDEAGAQPSLKGTPWGEVVGACSDQPMMDQFSVGYCSVTLVAPDLAATAYHCLGWLGCDELAVIRSYQFEAEAQLEPFDTDADVRFCTEFLTPALEPGAPPPEIGWIRLSRPFPPFQATLPVVDVGLGTPVMALAHLGGVPLKLLDAASVQDEQVAEGARVLWTNLDSFHGASGGPVLTENRELAAIVAGGAPDFVPTEAGCLRLSVGPNEPGEERAVVYSDVRSKACLATDDPACVEPPPGVGSPAGCSMGRGDLPAEFPWAALAGLAMLRARWRRHDGA
jgi:hypothetical protein